MTQNQSPSNDKVQSFMEVVCRRRGVRGTEDTPLMEKWTKALLARMAKHGERDCDKEKP